MENLHPDRKTQNDTIRRLVSDMEKKLPGEGGHSIRVSVISVAIGESLGMGPEELLDLRFAAALHDIGKLEMDPSLLHKEEAISDEEREALQSHAINAMRVIDDIPWLAPAAEMIVSHHEKWDGTGYPDGLVERDIPLGARIIAVAETYDVLISGSRWQQALTEEQAMDELRRCAGTQFDPDVVSAFEPLQPLIQPISG